MTLEERLRAVITDIGTKLKSLRTVPVSDASGKILKSDASGGYGWQEDTGVLITDTLPGSVSRSTLIIYTPAGTNNIGIFLGRP